MLSLSACRKLLAPSGAALSDSELERLRDDLYLLAELGVQMFRESENRSTVGVRSGPSFRDAIELVPSEERHAVEERAAIVEAEAGIDRDVAERLALERIVQQRRCDNA
jgi:hypothetical protein